MPGLFDIRMFYRHIHFLSCSHACFVLSVVLLSMQGCSLDSAALTVLFVLLLSMQGFRTRLCCSHACFVYSVMLLFMQYSLARLCCSLHAFCNLFLAFMTDFTLSGRATRNRFIGSAGKVCSIRHLVQNTYWQYLHTFSHIGTTVSNCG